MSFFSSLLIFGGVAFAYQQGYLRPFMDELSSVYGNDTGVEIDVVTPPNVPEASVVAVEPKAVSVSKYEDVLLRNEFDVSNWSWKYRKLTAAIIWQESNANPKALGPVIQQGANKGDRAHGLMQVMPITARDMHKRLGYRKYTPTGDVLLSEAGGVYFGTHYLEHLSKIAPSPDDYKWIVRAYYGGPNHENASAKWRAEHDKYLNSVESKFMRIHEGKV